MKTKQNVQRSSSAKMRTIMNRGGVEDTRLEATRLEAKAKDTKKIRGQGQGQPFRGQTLSRPRTQAQVLSKKKKGLHKNFSGDLHKNTFPKNFSSAPQNFNNSKNSAVLEPRTGQFSRTPGQGLDLRGQGLQNVSSRTSPLIMKLLGGCRCRPLSNYWVGCNQIIGEINPPRVSAPLVVPSG